MYTLRRVRSQAKRIVIISTTTTTASKLRERIIKAITILRVAAYAAVSKPAARAIAVRRRWGLAVGEPHAIGNMGGVGGILFTIKNIQMKQKAKQKKMEEATREREAKAKSISRYMQATRADQMAST